MEERILTPEQISQMSVDEINATLRKELNYDEYRYQKDNGIRITEPYRAEGLHKVLYQCPRCMTEFKMDSKGTELFCTECGKRWNWNEDGNLEALDGETEFPHIPDWYAWQRQQVRKVIRKRIRSLLKQMWKRGDIEFWPDYQVLVQFLPLRAKLYRFWLEIKR